ncbi:CoA-binding protein [Rhizobium sp. 2YAF20]|uniref:CoA-binding protein n=1 Tax=Rhizobium sp. 2YAF20 TaxID=3233027 RepID=UPI003F9B3F94
MSIKNLASLFHPRSVAVTGASNRADAIGTRILENVLHGGFPGQVWPVNPNHAQLLEQKCYTDIPTLPAAPDIAIIATPASTVPLVLQQLGENGTKIAVVVAAGLTDKTASGRPRMRPASPMACEFSDRTWWGLFFLAQGSMRASC